MKKLINIGCSFIFALKWDLKMKLTAFFLLVCMLQINATTYSQKTRISLDMNDVPLSKVLNRIETISEFKFFVDTQKIDVKFEVNIKADKEKIFDILDKLFLGTDITYEVYNKQILLKKVDVKPTKKSISTGPDQSYFETKILQQAITGSISDKDGTPLPGANILEKGTTNGTQADFDGNFSLELENENAVLVISYVGFATKEVGLNGKTDLTITLEESAAGLDEVVVVGYGTQQKKDVTGSISTISAENFEQRPVANVESALQGLSPGINIADRNSRPGELGTVSIRAIGSISAGYEPLWVIDGFPTDQRNAAAINPADIASIDILKDASSTAIYGSRGANGVIIITTKSPRGGRSALNVSITSGVSSIADSARPKVLNSEEYVNFYTEANGGVTPTWINNSWDGVTNTDWRDELYQNALFQNYNISASGGNEKVSYLLSGGYINQGGVIPGEGSDKYSARLKVDYHITDRVKIGLNIAPNITQINLSSPNPQSPGNSFANIGGSSVIDLAESMPPILPVRRSDGSFSQGNDIAGVNYANPIELVENYSRTENLFRMLGGMDLTIEPIDGLIIKSTLSANIGSNEVESIYYAPTDGRRGNLPAESTLAIGQIQTNGWLNENTVNFKWQIGQDHSFDLLAGYTLQKDKSKFITSSVNGLPVTGVKVLSLGNSATLNSRNGLTENTLMSYLGRGNYSFKDRYLITGTVRSDGSSRFGSNNRFKTFGSFALGWRLSEEEFIKNLKVVDNAKIRVSYGTSGSNSIPNYIASASLDPTQWSFGGVAVTGANVGDPGNPDLTWETSTQLDIGLDLGLFKNRFNMVFDYYNNETTSLLLVKNVVPSSGFAGFLTNIGSLRNRGVEVALDARVINNNDFNWTIGGNVTWNQQEILDLGGVDEIRNYFGAVRQFVGGELQNIHLVNAIGIFREGDSAPAQPNSVPGDIIYEDFNGDGTISNFLGPDGQNLEGTNLDWIYGLNTSLKYKSFELSTLFNGQAGGSIFDQRLFLGEDGRLNIYKEKWYDGRYISESQPGDGVTPRAGGRLGQRTISTMIQKTDFFRFKNITLSYDLPETFLDKTGITNARMFFSVENIHTWTKFVGGNPEGRGNSAGGPSLLGGSRISGVDDSRELAVSNLAHLPLPRTFTLGINFSL